MCVQCAEVLQEAKVCVSLSVELRAGRPSLRAHDCRLSRMRCFLQRTTSARSRM